ncbi:MAG: hypothetical protein HQL73_13440 [Magnetococcales bacterium]|nr:hypothetical protein [Magnetococcales bacterium]
MQVGPYYTSVWENTPFCIDVSDPIAKTHQITHYADSRVPLLSDWGEYLKTNDEYRAHAPMTTRTLMGAWVETFAAWRIELVTESSLDDITRTYAFKQANCGNMDWDTEVWQNGTWEAV